MSEDGNNGKGNILDAAGRFVQKVINPEKPQKPLSDLVLKKGGKLPSGAASVVESLERYLQTGQQLNTRYQLLKNKDAAMQLQFNSAFQQNQEVLIMDLIAELRSLHNGHFLFE
jgi:hypothetical protein